jgi:hypothetical protein
MTEPSAETIAYMETVLQRYIDNPPEAPEHGEAYKSPYWDMVRELKDDCFMASLAGYLAIPILQKVLAGRGYALTALGYESDPMGMDRVIEELERAWDAVKLGMQEAPLGAAVRMARRHPLRFRTNRLSVIYQKFLNIAYYLQRMREDDYIALPVVRLGQMLGVSPRCITDFRKFATNEGFLRLEAKACYSRDGGIATKFRFACRVGDGEELIGTFLLRSAFEIETPTVKSEGLTHSSHNGLEA